MSGMTFKQAAGIGNEVISNGEAKIIDIGANGLPGSTTVINLGSGSGGATIVNLFGQPITPVAASYGPTANRPVPTTISQKYFDTTLGLPIWCSQVSPAIWVNAAGVSV